MRGVADLLRFMERYQPGYSRRVAGITPEQVSLLQDLQGRIFPQSYVEFLLTLGRDHGGLVLAGQAATEFEPLSAWLQDVVNELGPDGIPEGCVLIGRRYFPGIDLGLQLNGGQEPHVVAVDEEVLFPLAASLYHLLMSRVFLTQALPALGCRRALGGRAPSDPDAAWKIAEGLGFAPTPFADRYSWCAERPGAAIVVQQVPGEPLSVVVGAREAPTLQALCDRLEEALGVSASKVLVQR